jgi:peptidyl-prolyl cis-trans isomerase C
MSYLAELYARERIDAAITGEAVETEYAQRYAQEEPKLEFNASHILVPEEETAKEIAELARGDVDFAELAKERSTGPSGPNGGNLGWFGDGQMVPAFEAGVKELAVGGVSDPIQTQFGWHVIKLLETREKAPPALSEVYQELAGDMARQITDAMVQALREDGSVEFIEGTPGLGSLRDDKLIEE